jgi:hypothetical protein
MACLAPAARSPGADETTAGSESSLLADATLHWIENLDADRPIAIDAFVSPAEGVPEFYSPTRTCLLAVLRSMEIHAKGTPEDPRNRALHGIGSRHCGRVRH